VQEHSKQGKKDCAAEALGDRIAGIGSGVLIYKKSSACAIS
jgi:hypothetical protein